MLPFISFKFAIISVQTQLLAFALDMNLNETEKLVISTCTRNFQVFRLPSNRIRCRFFGCSFFSCFSVGYFSCVICYILELTYATFGAVSHLHCSSAFPWFHRFFQCINRFFHGFHRFSHRFHRFSIMFIDLCMFSSMFPWFSVSFFICFK